MTCATGLRPSPARAITSFPAIVVLSLSLGLQTAAQDALERESRRLFDAVAAGCPHAIEAQGELARCTAGLAASGVARDDGPRIELRLGAHIGRDFAAERLAVPSPGAEQTPGQPESPPWRLQHALEEAGAPPWLRVSGEIRLRYEGIDGQFRSAGRLDDQDHVFVMRTLLEIEADFDPVVITVEGLDGRQYGGNFGSALGTSSVNAAELLQAHVTVRLGALGSGTHHLRGGRQTMNLGSRRLVARSNSSNTVNAFTGLLWEWKGEDFKATAFYTLPIRRMPRDIGSIIDNEIEFDDEDFDLQFFGVHYERAVFDEHVVEVFGFGLLDDVTGSRDRDVFTAGVRFLLPKKRGRFDYEVEGAYQFGESRLSATGPRLDHSAGFAHVSLGYTFDAPWAPRLRVAFDYASGDDDPTDGNNERFDALFGSRRFEYGPTGIYGAIARVNLLSPELRLELKPRSDMQWMVAWRVAMLASKRDAWTAAGVQDPTGRSGRLLGHQFESRWRWDVLETVRLEVGVAFLAHGDFQDEAPGGQRTDTLYGYASVRWSF